MVDWITVYSYEKALEALRNENEAIQVFCFSEGNEVSFTAFTEEIARNTSCTYLSLYFNVIGPGGVKKIANALEVNFTLTDLSLQLNKIGSIGAETIAGALEINTNLISLNLSENRIGNKGATAIAKALKVNKTLSLLSLDSNKLGPDGAKQLASALKQNAILNGLSLVANFIGDDGSISLVSAVVRNSHSTLESLDLSYNAISNVGAQNIEKKIKNLPGRLKPLEVKVNGNFVTSKGLSDQQRKYLARRVANKKTRWGQCKLMVIGEGRAGKTQTIRSLVGDTFEKESVSTLAGKIDLVQSLVSGKFTRIGEDVDVEIQSLFNDLIEKEKIPMKKTFRIPFTAKKRENEAQKHAEKMFENVIVPERGQAEESNVGIGVNDRLVFTIWDFGGQDIFKAIHHLFLSDDGVYLLVFDMAKLLSVANREESINTLLFWLRSIEMHSKEAPILIVGTHLDRCGHDHEHAIENINDVLEKIVPKKIARSIYKYQDQLFFPVDNTRLEGSDRTIFEYLRSAIIEKAQSLRSVTRNDIPMRWLLYLDSIRERKNQEPTDDLDYLKGDLKEFSIEGDEAKRMLQFFHKMGIFLHWNNTESLNDTVVLKPQWIISASARIVHSKKWHEEYLIKGLLKRSKNQEMYKHMHKTGIIQRELLENVLWVDDCFKHRIDFLTVLFEQMLLLCKYDHDSFIIPSLLRNLDDKSKENISAIIQQKWEDVSNNVKNSYEAKATIKFSWLPSGLFERIVCVCVRTGTKDGLKVTSFGWNELLYFVKIEIGFIPVRLAYIETENVCEVKVCATDAVNTIELIKDLYETMVEVIKQMRLNSVATRLYLLGENEHEFDFDTVTNVNASTVTVMSVKAELLPISALGPWYKEKLQKPGLVSGPSLASWNLKDLNGRLTPSEFSENRHKWRHEWDQIMDLCEVEMKNVNTEKNALYHSLKVLIDGPMSFLAELWKDVLKQYGGNRALDLNKYKAVVTEFFDASKCLKTIELWTKQIFVKIAGITTIEHRYGVFFSHQGNKIDNHGERVTIMKQWMKELRNRYQRELSFVGGESVPVFFDQSMTWGDNQYESMLFSICATDKVMVFIDKEYFTKKWCIMEYFLARQRPESMMPCLVDNPVILIDLPDGTVYERMDAKFNHDETIKTLQLFFGKV